MKAAKKFIKYKDEQYGSERWTDDPDELESALEEYAATHQEGGETKAKNQELVKIAAYIRHEMYNVEYAIGHNGMGVEGLKSLWNELSNIVTKLDDVTLPQITDWDKLREKYFDECCDIKPSCYVPPPMDVPTSMKRVAIAPHDLFEWFKSELMKGGEG